MQSWINYGILNHNEYYTIRNGELKYGALLKTILNSTFIFAALRLIFYKSFNY